VTPAVIGRWIAETQAKEVTAQAEIRAVTGQPRMSRDEIAVIVAALGDLVQTVRDADPIDKADIRPAWPESHVPPGEVTGRGRTQASSPYVQRGCVRGA
jgi:hypothetical protein